MHFFNYISIWALEPLKHLNISQARPVKFHKCIKIITYSEQMKYVQQMQGFLTRCAVCHADGAINYEKLQENKQVVIVMFS